MAYKMEDYKVEDCRRIVNLLESIGYIVTMEEAHRLWSMHSDDYCAGWLSMSEEDEDVLRELNKLLITGYDNRNIVFKVL